MKIICFIMILFGYSITMSSEIIGLDSIDLGNRIIIQNLRQSVHTGKIDTLLSYLYVIEREGHKKPDLLLKQTEYPDKLMLIEGDSIISYFLDEQEYKKFKSNVYDYNNELSLYYQLIYSHRNPHTALQLYTLNIKVESTTQIIPEKNEIRHSSKFFSPNGIISTYDLIINKKDSDRIEYKSYSINNGDTVHQLSSHYIYSKSDDEKPFDFLEDFYSNGRMKYTLKESSPVMQKQPKGIAVGDTIDLDFTLYGLNREDLNIRDYFRTNAYLILYTWGTWCGPCISNTENIKEFNAKYKKPGFATIMDEKGKANEEEKKIYVEKKAISYPVYFNDEFVKKNKFYSFPTFAVIGKDGVVLEIIEGYNKVPNRYDDIITKYGE